MFMFCPVNEREASSAVFCVLFLWKSSSPTSWAGEGKDGFHCFLRALRLVWLSAEGRDMVVPISLMLNGTVDHMWASVWERACMPGRCWGFSQASLRTSNLTAWNTAYWVRRWRFTCFKKKTYVAHYHRHALCFRLTSSATILFFVVKILTLSVNRILIKN